MQQKLIDLSTQYLQAGNAIHDAIRDIIKDEGGFINASNNKQVKTDIKALVFNSKTGYSETFPITFSEPSIRISTYAEAPLRSAGGRLRAPISCFIRQYYP